LRKRLPALLTSERAAHHALIALPTPDRRAITGF
jgi:hypothetical protein